MSDKIKRNDNKGIEITKPSYDKQAVVSTEGIEIRREGKPISSEITRSGILYLLIDCSGSMAGDKLDQAKRGAVNFTKEAKIKGYTVGLIKFHSYATHLCEPQREISVLSRYLEPIQVEGGTNMVDAFHLAFEKLRDKIGNRVVVLVTDGQPTDGEPTPEEATLREAYKIKKNGIDIITIGTDDADREFLRKIATRTDLAVMVSREKLEKGITSTAKKLPMLPKGK